MAKRRGSDVVSIWFWLISMVVLAVPVVNIVMTLVWAFTGENESRKNYFKALIVMFFLIFGLMSILVSLGMLPALVDQLRAMPR
jgi:hypothetical protein